MCPDSYGPSSVGRQQCFGSSLRNYCAASAPYQIPTASDAYDPLNMNYSIYGSDIDLTSDYSIGGGYGYAPGGYIGGGYGYNPDMMYEQMDKWTDYMYDRNAKYIEKGRANDMRVNGPLEAAQYAADAVREKIVKDDQPQIKIAFEKYKAALVKLYPEYAKLDDKVLSAKAMELYKERNGIGFKDDIRANSSNIFMQKFLHGATFGLCFKGSAEETISDITGNPMSNEDRLKSAVGTTAGGLASITAGFQLFKHSGKIWSLAAKNPICTLIVAGAAALGIFNYTSGSKS